LSNGEGSTIRYVLIAHWITDHLLLRLQYC
jgi:hypothetical protein